VAVSRDRQQHWARLGAKTRLGELRLEISEILRAYPDLRRESSSAVSGPRSGRRRHISPEARAAMSEGMRKYWARRKAQKGRKDRAKAS
jgi:hypothetical protein